MLFPFILFHVNQKLIKILQGMETYKSIHSGFQDIMHIKFDRTTENAYVFSSKHREVMYIITN